MFNSGLAASRLTMTYSEASSQNNDSTTTLSGWFVRCIPFEFGACGRAFVSTVFLGIPDVSSARGGEII